MKNIIVLLVYIYLLMKVFLLFRKKKERTRKKKEHLVNWIIANSTQGKFTCRHTKSAYSARTFIWFADVEQTEWIKEKKPCVTSTVRNYSIIREFIHFGFPYWLQFCLLFRKMIEIFPFLTGKLWWYWRHLILFLIRIFNKYFSFLEIKESSSGYFVRLWSNFVSIKNDFYLHRKRDEIKTQTIIPIHICPYSFDILNSILFLMGTISFDCVIWLSQ